MKKYSKGKLRFKRFFAFFVALFVMLLIIGVVLLFGFCLKDRFDISSDINDAMNVSEDVAINSQPIVIDNLVVGGIYNNTWVSASKYYLKSKNKTDLDTYVYSKEKRAGEYKIKDTYTYGDSVFVNVSYPNYIDEYFAIPTDVYALSSQFNQAEVTESDYNYVKKALGIYRLYNSSMNIKKVYSGYINIDNPIRIICLTSSNKGTFGGVYSAIVVANLQTNKAKILQYSYTKDLQNSYDFPLYSVEFLADFNGDGNAEIVTREVTEFNVTYNVFEYSKDQYKKVLCETMKEK